MCGRTLGELLKWWRRNRVPFLSLSVWNPALGLKKTHSCYDWASIGFHGWGVSTLGISGDKDF